MAKLSALNKELTERNQDEELQRLQVLLNVKEGASVILTKIDPLNAGPDAVNIGGGLYRVKKPIDMREQSVDVSSEDNKLGSLRSINVKLAEQLRQKSQEIETLEKQSVSEQENAEKIRIDLESQIRHLREEITEHKNNIQALEAERINLSNQTSMAKESLERHQANYEEFQKRIQFLEQELMLRSKSEQDNKNVKDHIDPTGYEQGIKEKDETIASLQAEIAEFTARQSAMEEEFGNLQRALEKSQEIIESVEAPRINTENEEIGGLKRQIEELLLQREAPHHQVYDTEDLQSQLEDAQTTVNVHFLN